MNSKIPTLKFAPDALRRLGEELIPNPEQGLIELVKNSYDADALACTIKIENITKVGGSIFIEDNGIGMTESDLIDGFLVIGKSKKSSEKRTKLERLPAGDKGLGRIAALRLGSQVVVKSRPASKLGKEFVLKIDWNIIDQAAVVEDVILKIDEHDTHETQGVTIEILNLRKPFSQDEVSKLAHELLLLVDPFKNETGFKIKLITDEYKRLEEIVSKTYFEDADFFLTADIDDNGVGKVTLKDSNSIVLVESTLPLKGKANYKIPKLSFELWMFVFGQSFTAKQTKQSVVKDWMKYVGGVHIYHRKLRIRPYGDPGSDWLDMNLSRVSHPEFRPSTNNSIGRITTEDPSSILKQPTSRIGFVEDHTFLEIKRFAQDAILWAAAFRLKRAEKERSERRKAAKKDSEKALDAVKSLIRSAIPEKSAKEVEQALTKFTNAQNKEVLSLKEELQLYRSLATAGTTSAVFAHEAAKPIMLIGSLADTIERRGMKYLEESIYNQNLSEPIATLKKASSSLNVYSQFPVYHLRKIKRISGPINISEVWSDVADLFKPLLDESKIGLNVSFTDDDTKIVGSIALIEAIATNLITNSIHALTSTKAVMSGREIRITSSIERDFIKVTHEDNGPGIQIDVDTIWLPGITTNLDGTGFGLTIVRDSIADLKGSIRANANGSLGGAEFIIDFPLAH